MGGLAYVKMIYIGRSDSLASNVIDQLTKEGHSVTLLAKQSFQRGLGPKLRYKRYPMDPDSLGLEKVFSSIRPDVVIVAPAGCEATVWEYNKETNAYLANLLNVLNQAAMSGVSKMVLLSSGAVYGHKNSPATEEDGGASQEYKGILCAQGEALFEHFCDTHFMQPVVLRMGDLFGFALKEGKEDFVSRFARACQKEEPCPASPNRTLNPVYLPDAAQAVVRACGVTPAVIYNVGAKEPVSEHDAARLVEQACKKNGLVTALQQEAKGCGLVSRAISAQLEWTQFYSLVQVLSEGGVDLTPPKQQQAERKKLFGGSPWLQTLENVLLFFLSAGLTLLFRQHSVLSTIDLFFLYILCVSLLFGIRQSILSVLLSCLFLAGEAGFSVTAILMDAEVIVKIAQYIFVGMAVGYTVDQYRIQVREKETDYAYLENEYRELREINDENVKIKLEYEDRLLNYKTSLPQLYSVIRRISVLQKDKIFGAIVDVVKDIMETDTVSVYAKNAESPYIRLLVSSDPQAQEKSLNLSEYPEMRQTLEKGEVFIGSRWEEKQPALAAPILYEGQCIAVVVIRCMPFEGMNLYHVNLFRTLAGLITDVVISANEYERAAREKKYIGGTDILTKDEFARVLAIRMEEKQKGLADCCLLEVQIEGTLEQTGERLSSLLRITDSIGAFEEGNLRVLLANTSKREAAAVIGRLTDKGLHADVVSFAEDGREPGLTR